MKEFDKKDLQDDIHVRMEERLQEIGTRTSVILELVVALIVFAACIVGIVHLFPDCLSLITSYAGGDSLMEFMEEVFLVVIGIEFLKMLCKPTSENVLETIIFLVARHMIINTTSPLEDLLSTIAIVMLVVAKRYLRHVSNKDIPFLDGVRVKSVKAKKKKE